MCNAISAKIRQAHDKGLRQGNGKHPQEQPCGRAKRVRVHAHTPLTADSADSTWTRSTALPVETGQRELVLSSITVLIPRVKTKHGPSHGPHCSRVMSDDDSGKHLQVVGDRIRAHQYPQKGHGHEGPLPTLGLDPARVFRLCHDETSGGNPRSGDVLRVTTAALQALTELSRSCSRVLRRCIQGVYHSSRRKGQVPQRCFQHPLWARQSQTGDGLRRRRRHRDQATGGFVTGQNSYITRL